MPLTSESRRAAIGIWNRQMSRNGTTTNAFAINCVHGRPCSVLPQHMTCMKGGHVGREERWVAVSARTFARRTARERRERRERREKREAGRAAEADLQSHGREADVVGVRE